MSNLVGDLKPKINLQGELYKMGTKGYSAYEVAVQQGFEGTVDEWLASLIGPQGPQGVQGVTGPQGLQGVKGETGDSGVYIGDEEPTDKNVDVWIDTNEEADESSYVLPIASNTVLGGIKVGANLHIEPDGTLNAEAGGTSEGTGENGATFTPTVSSDGVISWSNDKGLSNPTPVNIRGPQGLQGVKGETGPQGNQGEPGEKGATGDSGVYVGTDEPTDENVDIWINPDGDGVEYVDETRVSQLINNAITDTLGGEY